ATSKSSPESWNGDPEAPARHLSGHAGPSRPARGEARDGPVPLDVGRAVAQLAELVGAPGEQRAVRPDRQRVPFAGGHELPAGTERLAELVAVVAVGVVGAEPAARIGAARPERAVRLERDGEPAARRDVDPVVRLAELLRARRSGDRPQAELAADVAATAPQRAVGLDRHAGAAGDLS